MIKFEETEVWGFKHAIRGMRNPMNSRDRSDSYYETEQGTCEPIYIIGQNDLNLMKRLIKAGSEHRKFLRQIKVSVDITAANFWWNEFDTYKVGTTANSTSVMHKIMSKPFTEDMFSWERCYLQDWKDFTLQELNYLRARWLETKDKKDWYCLIQMLPRSYNYRRTVEMSYENIYNMYCQRVLVPHKLDEWSIDFKKWCESLPYFKELFIDNKKDNK